VALANFGWGFFVNIITGLDDTVTHVPVIASIARSRAGKIAFASGMLVAILIAITLARAFAQALAALPHTRFIVAGLLVALAFIVYFRILQPTKVERKLLKMQKLTALRATKLFGTGFIAAFATVIDDVVAYTPLFLEPNGLVFTMLGIISATIVQLLLIIYAAEKIARIPYKEAIASVGLLTLAALTATSVI